jgi:hypothetical protein
MNTLRPLPLRYGGYLGKIFFTISDFARNPFSIKEKEILPRFQFYPLAKTKWMQF